LEKHWNNLKIAFYASRNHQKHWKIGKAQERIGKSFENMGKFGKVWKIM